MLPPRLGTKLPQPGATGPILGTTPRSLSFSYAAMKLSRPIVQTGRCCRLAAATPLLPDGALITSSDHRAMMAAGPVYSPVLWSNLGRR